MSRRPPIRRPAVVLVAVLVTAACASAPPREQLVLSSWQPPPGQECRVSSTEPLPIARLADSTALVGAVANAGLPPGAALLSLRSDTTGAWSDVRLIESSLERGATERVVAAVRSHLRDPDPADPVRARLRVGTGPPPVLEVGVRETCMPVLRNGVILERAIESAPRRGVSRDAWAALLIRIDTLGEVMEVELDEDSGDERFNQIVLAVAPHLRFHPALNDRQKVSVWIEIPVTLYFRASDEDPPPPR